MEKYAIRTCDTCGIRREQPEMERVQVSVKTGKTFAGLSVRTFLGILFGSQKASSAIGRAIFNTAQRTRYSFVTQWFCQDCFQDFYRTETRRAIARRTFIFSGVALAAWIVYVNT